MTPNDTAPNDTVDRPATEALEAKQSDVADGRATEPAVADPGRDPSTHPDEPGAYVGRLPERQADSIPGGVSPDDERIAAHSTTTRGRRRWTSLAMRSPTSL